MPGLSGFYLLACGVLLHIVSSVNDVRPSASTDAGVAEWAKAEASRLMVATGAVRRVGTRAVRSSAVADPLPPDRSELLWLAFRRPGIGVTEAGAARISQWRDIRTDLVGRALSRLSTADQQAIAAAIPALTRLAEQMEEL